MLHKKSLETFGNETLPSRKNYTRNHYQVKRIKHLPPNGRFYQDVSDGVSQFPEKSLVLIYIGKDKPWEYAKLAKELGLQPPIVIDFYLNPKAYHWPVKGLKVRVIEWTQISDKTMEELALELYLAGAVEVQFQSFCDVAPLINPRRIVVRYE